MKRCALKHTEVQRMRVSTSWYLDQLWTFLALMYPSPYTIAHTVSNLYVILLSLQLRELPPPPLPQLPMAAETTITSRRWYRRSRPVPSSARAAKRSPRYRRMPVPGWRCPRRTTSIPVCIPIAYKHTCLLLSALFFYLYPSHTLSHLFFLYVTDCCLLFPDLFVFFVLFYVRAFILTPLFCNAVVLEIRLNNMLWRRKEMFLIDTFS